MKLSPKGGSFYMASKGQKFRRYTEEFKQRVLEEYFGALNYRVDVGDTKLSCW